MARYDYRCAKCLTVSTLRRLIGEMDDPADCLNCGSPLARLFTPTTNIHIPIAFRQVLTGGDAGGGGLSWSDFHDKSEREMAKDPNAMSWREAMSKPGMGSKSTTKPAYSMGDADKAAKEQHNVLHPA